MGITNFPKVTDDMGIEELRNLVAILIKEVEFLANGGIDSHNIREVGGYKVNANELKHRSGIVGLNGANPNIATEVRFWAGHATPSAAPFKVQQDGKLFATGAVIQNTTSGERVVIDNTGFHTYDSSGIERLTIGTAPVEGVKAIIGRDTSGVKQSVYTYDTETTTEGTLTGQYITSHGSFLLFDAGGDVRLLNSDGGGFRQVGTSRAQISSASSSWNDIALKSEADARGFTLSYNSGTKDLTMRDKNGLILSTVNLT